MKKYRVSAVFVWFMVCVSISVGKILTEKPDWLNTCVIADPVPEFTKCSTTAIQALFRQLNTGIEGLDTLTTIDPFKIKKLNILNGGNGPVTLDASLSNVKVTGFANTVIKENKVSRKDYSWETHLFLPKMRVEGNYRMNGRILVIPLTGNGKCWLEPEKLDIITHTKVNLYNKEGHVFYNVNTISVDFSMKGLKLHLDNLFEGSRELGETTNRYLNENWRDVSEAFRPIIAKTIEDILIDILRKIFDYMPGDFYVSDLPKQ